MCVLRDAHCTLTDSFGCSLSDHVRQVAEVNRGVWNQIERGVRDLAADPKYGEVYVCSGPVFAPERLPDGEVWVRYRVIGRNHVAVPTHFFKVALSLPSNPGHLDSDGSGGGDGGPMLLSAWLVPNKAEAGRAPPASFLVPVEVIERLVGFRFYPHIPRAAAMTVLPPPRQ